MIKLKDLLTEGPNKILRSRKLNVGFYEVTTNVGIFTVEKFADDTYGRRKSTVWMITGPGQTKPDETAKTFADAKRTIMRWV